MMSWTTLAVIMVLGIGAILAPVFGAPIYVGWIIIKNGKWM